MASEYRCEFLFAKKSYMGPDQTRPDGGGWGWTGPDGWGGSGLDQNGGGGRTRATSAEQGLLMDLVLARMSILEEIRT